MSKQKIELSKDDQKRIQKLTKQQHDEMKKILEQFTEKTEKMVDNIIEERMKEYVTTGKGIIGKMIDKAKDKYKKDD